MFKLPPRITAPVQRLFTAGIARWNNVSGPRAFHKDAAMLHRFTDARLQLTQFDQYQGQFTLSARFGTPRDHYREHYHYGISSGISRADAGNVLLDALADAGVVFDLGDPNNNGLLASFERNIETLLRMNRWPSVPLAYRNSPTLVASAARIRAELGMNPMEHPL